MRKKRSRFKPTWRSNPGLVALYLPSDPKDNPFSALIARNDPYAFAQTVPLQCGAG